MTKPIDLIVEELDGLLLAGSLDPGDLRRVLGENDGGCPDGFADQVDAAIKDAHRVADYAITRGIYASSKDLTYKRHPQWLRLRALNALITWFRGGYCTCKHAPHPDHPQPIYAAAWKPGLIVCIRCVSRFQEPAGCELDRTCDGCGRVTAGLDVGDPIFPCQLHLSVLTYAFGVCTACKY